MNASNHSIDIDSQDFVSNQYPLTSCSSQKELFPAKSFLQKIFVILRQGWWQYARKHLTLQEISGSLGDLGTFLPLVTAMAIKQVNELPQLSFGPALFFSGVYTLCMSTYFSTPLPVQPMKTIAAVALVSDYTREQILASGILLALCILILSVTRLISVLQALIPLALVRGIQLGLGLALMIKGIELAYVHSLQNGVKVIIWLGLDSVLTSIILLIFCLIFLSNKKVPVAIIIFLYGLVISLYRYYNLDIMDKKRIPLVIGPNFDAPITPSWNDFIIAFKSMVLPQLPLTLLNSIIALEKLSSDLFIKSDVSVERISSSLIFGNLCFCWFGMTPSCHGAGGLASQYAFGARSNVSMIFLGMIKIFLALLFGSSSVALLQQDVFPSSVLGIMLFISGLNLAMVTRDVNDPNGIIIVLVTSSTSLAIDSGIGFIFGALTSILLKYFPKEIQIHQENTYLLN